MEPDGRDVFDLLVVGGGINGAGIARDAAGRGLSVLLAERDDLASHTSSGSTKLIHGGLRYLETYEFALVRKALAERERLLRSAPHILWPLRFVLPHERHLRPAWMIRIGLFLYDHLAKRHWLPGSHAIDLRRHAAGVPLRGDLVRGFEYSDGWADDARLVVLAARDAADRGARIEVGCRVVSAHREGGLWDAVLEPRSGRRFDVRAHALVNATGPWAAQWLRDALPARDAPRHGLRLVRGSHLVLDKLFDHDYAYIFQNADSRIVFAVPYERDFTLLGTTDRETQSPDDPVAADDEVDYLLAVASRHFKRPVDRSMIRHRYSAVRPLLEGEGSASEASRDYHLEVIEAEGAPLMNVWGGKITTFRRLAEDAVDALSTVLDRSTRSWTSEAVLPGGALPGLDAPDVDPQAAFRAFVETLAARHADRPRALVERLARLYGTVAGPLLGASPHEIVEGVPEVELEHAWSREWARSGDDFLWRRTKLALHLDAPQREAIVAWFEARAAREPDRSA